MTTDRHDSTGESAGAGPMLVSGRVDTATTISERYRQHASHQSMTVYLNDWERAHARLGRQIETLRTLRDQRKAEAEGGEWPPPPAEKQVCMVTAHQPVVDLMAALEKSVSEARAAARTAREERRAKP